MTTKTTRSSKRTIICQSEKMDVEDSNTLSVNYRNYLKSTFNSIYGDNFSMETYFVWFSALIFITEFLTDICLVCYYIHQEETQWGLITLAIIILPLILCQLCSLVILRLHKKINFSILLIHLALLGIPYRYHEILRRVDKNKMSNQEMEILQQLIRDVNTLQGINAILQYFPQFSLQVFLIVDRKFKCVITGVSAGLAGFSFLWHIFLNLYYFKKRCKGDDLPNGSNAHMMIDNLTLGYPGSSSTVVMAPGAMGQSSGEITSSSMVGNIRSESLNNNENQDISLKSFEKANLTDNLKIFEKKTYKTDDRNLVSKKQPLKNVEKSKIFGFNKRKTVYDQASGDYNQEIDFCEDVINQSADPSMIFSEVNTTTTSTSSENIRKLNISNGNNRTMEVFNNENNMNLCRTTASTLKQPNKSKDNEEHQKAKEQFFQSSPLKCTPNLGSFENLTTECRALKRKGICSSQEMLHLVDFMCDIPPEQVDILAKSLIEMSGGSGGAGADGLDESNFKRNYENLMAATGLELDNPKLLLEQFPEVIDSKLMENIEAAIYENQIIFEERIRKNKLTIQNLKLQDQLLSKYLEEVKNLPSTEMINIRDYENMCFANVNRQNRLKHWRNYIQDIDTNLHDNSTVQNSSFYVNTMSNSMTDLYVNGTDIGSVVTEDGKLSDQISIPLPPASSVTHSTNSADGAIENDEIRTIATTIPRNEPEKTGERQKGRIRDNEMNEDCCFTPKKYVRWSERLEESFHNENQFLYLHSNMIERSSHHRPHQRHREQQQLEEGNDDKIDEDNVYINITGVDNHYLPRKNILVETINAINVVESPFSSHIEKDKTILPESINKK